MCFLLHYQICQSCHYVTLIFRQALSKPLWSQTRNLPEIWDYYLLHNNLFLDWHVTHASAGRQCWFFRRGLRLLTISTMPRRDAGSAYWIVDVWWRGKLWRLPRHWFCYALLFRINASRKYYKMMNIVQYPAGPCSFSSGWRAISWRYQCATHCWSPKGTLTRRDNEMIYGKSLSYYKRKRNRTSNLR